MCKQAQLHTWGSICHKVSTIANNLIDFETILVSCGGLSKWTTRKLYFSQRISRGRYQKQVLITVLRLRSRLTTATPGMLSPLPPLTPPLTMGPPLAVAPPLGPGDCDLLEPALVTDLRDLALATLLQVEILRQGIIFIIKQGPVIPESC